MEVSDQSRSVICCWLRQHSHSWFRVPSESMIIQWSASGSGRFTSEEPADPQIQVGRCGEQKNLLPLPEIEHRYPSRLFRISVSTYDKAIYITLSHKFNSEISSWITPSIPKSLYRSKVVILASISFQLSRGNRDYPCSVL
jgi:hypothetical protein